LAEWMSTGQQRSTVTTRRKGQFGPTFMEFYLKKVTNSSGLRDRSD